MNQESSKIKRRNKNHKLALDSQKSKSNANQKISNNDAKIKTDTSTNSSSEPALKKRKKSRKYHKIGYRSANAKKEESPNSVANKTIAAYPKNQTNISSNWKNLLESLETSKLNAAMESPKSSRTRINRAPFWNRRTNSKISNDEPDIRTDALVVSHKRKSVATNSDKTLSKSPKLNTLNKSALNNNGSKGIWFDDVDPDLIEPQESTLAVKNPQRISNSNKKENSLIKPGSFKGITKAIGMDCEMVGIGCNGQDSILARVSLVNLMGHCIYDKFVKPTEPVTDYRTEVSGVRPADLEKGEDFKVVQKEISDLLNGRILVGHAVYNDLKVLFLGHPKSKIRDTSTYKPFRQLFNGSTPSLKRLAEKLLGVRVQEGEHSSIQDAQATMRLYTMYKRTWETEIKNRLSAHKKKVVKKPIHFSPGATKMSQLKI